MKCQVCGTKEPTQFQSSVLICASCLAKKMLNQYTLQQLKGANLYLKQMMDQATIFGLPVVDFHTAQTESAASAHSEPLTVEKLMDMMEKFKQQHQHPKPTLTFPWDNTPLTLPPDAPNCKCIAPEYDSIKATKEIREYQVDMFGHMMKRPIRIDPEFVRYLSDIHFGSTTPLLENTALPLPAS